MLSLEQKALLTETAAQYYEALNAETASYLKSRGISKEVAATFLLGTVTNPAPGHEHAVGAGQKIGMFNVNDLGLDTETMCICEGEIDTIILSGMCGIPAVGVAGVTQWKDWFPMMLEGYKRIFVFADNDVKEDGRNPGMELAKRIKEDLNSAVVVNLPENKDVNDIFLREGADWFKEKIK